ncbi:MAG: bifunctional folylpolyglutamate synthase/dihydrofolate synthase [Microthrixaceae bacterium]
MDIAQAHRWLDGHLNHEATSAGIAAGMVEGLSLAPMRELMAMLGDPQQAMPVIHVTGTNGKGSVVAMLCRLLMANGLSVGTYTSPHLVRVNERIARDGQAISDEDLAEALSGVAAAEELLEADHTWFEVITAAALRWFADAPVDVAVVEVGLLGRYDATNVVDADVAVVTSIGGDHTDFAPGWELAVAGEKAGIITPDRPAVLGDVAAPLHEVFRAEGADPLLALGVDFEVLDARLAVGGRLVDLAGPHGTHLGVLVAAHGDHQVDNAAVAVCAAEEFFGRALEDDVVTEAFAELDLPGRLEVVAHQPLVVLDSAHNPDALARVAATLDDDFAVLGSRIVVLGMLTGRDPEDSLGALAAARPDLVVCTDADPGGRGMDPLALVAAAERLDIAAEVVADPAEALVRAMSIADEEDLVLVCGSSRLVGALRDRLRSGP